MFEHARTLLRAATGRTHATEVPVEAVDDVGDDADGGRSSVALLAVLAAVVVAVAVVLRRRRSDGPTIEPPF